MKYIPPLNFNMSSTYRTTCPRCGNNNYSIWFEDNRGTYCWNCGHTERQSTERVRILKRSPHIVQIRAFYKEISEWYNAQLQDEHYTYLFKRGISEHSIKTLKIGFCPDVYHPLYQSRVAILAGVYYKGSITHKNRIVFPFISEHGITDIWSRAYIPTDEVKYKGCFSPAFVRGSDYAYLHDNIYKDTYVIRTEGLIKGVIAQQYGFPIVCYPGTLAYRPGTLARANQIQVICFDNQVSHRRELIAAIKKEADRYYKPKIAVLPLRGNTKMDCDEYILRYGIDEFRRVIDGALEYEVWKKLVK